VSTALAEPITVERKAFPAKVEVKAPRGEPGRFRALVSVFNNVDRGGDRILPGAFKRTLEEKGMPPIVWTHMWNIPPIGKTLDAEETDEGLVIDGQLFVRSDDDHEVARQVHVAMREEALKEFSFAYDVVEARYVDEDGREIRELIDLELFEVGPTLVGMNPATRLIDAPKSALATALRNLDAKGWNELLTELKAGARNSSKDAERLQTIHDLAVENGASCEGTSPEENDEKSGEHPDPLAAHALLTARPMHPVLSQ
jgi:uncharacterized protein